MNHCNNIAPMVKDLENIVLTKSESKIVENGWGKDVTNNVILQKFIYDSDGSSVTGFIAFPKLAINKLPVIIWNRGGDYMSGLLDNFLAFGILGEIASWGYAVLASQYRENDEFGGADVNDVLNLIDIIDSFDFCDKELIGIEGWSRGAMMTFLTLTKSDKIKCSVSISGLTDLIRNEKLVENISSYYNVDSSSCNKKTKKEFLIERSAVYFAEKINKNTSVLFIHGTADEKISFRDSVDLYNKLSSYNNKAIYELKLIEGGDHYLRNFRKEVSGLRKKWYDSFLKL
jgi:dipeptidyl aminopeptidase/acylaminoacyl peptidase